MPRHDTPTPAWEEFTARHAVGDVIEGLVVQVLPYGALVDVAPGVPGLLTAESRPEPGARVPLRIAAIDGAKRRAAFTEP